MNTLFGKLFLIFTIIITLIIVTLMVSFTLIYAGSYEEQIIEDNDKQAMYIARELYSFMNNAYKIVEELSFNSDVLSMDTARQTYVFETAIERNEYFELLYAQGMDGMQTGRSSGTLGNRKERWWFVQMQQTQKPFISESYYSVGTDMPCASIFYPMTDGTEMIGIMAGDIRLSSLRDLVIEATDIENGTWAFILDGKGVVVAHPDKTFQEELYNYRTLTRTVTIKDEDGFPIKDAAGNVTEERRFEIPDAYVAAIEDMMQGNSDSIHFHEDGGTIFLSYRPVEMDGFSEPWYVLSVKDGDIVLQTRDTVILLIVISSTVIIFTALLVVLLTVRTISSRVKMEAMEAQFKIDKAQASERAKSDFLAMMSHEIRTPMNAILGVTEMHINKDDLPGEYMEAFETIYRSGHNLLGIINDILDLSTIETGRLELHPLKYDLPSLINDTVQVTTIRIGAKPLRLVLDIDASLPLSLYGDELRIKQILNNLLSNAVKYTSEGEVKLSIRVCHDARHRNDNMVFLIIKVSDTGQGMKPEDKEKLFTEYLRFNAEANRNTEGTGLGLSITKKLAELMGGEISAESEYGKGSVFTVKILQKTAGEAVIGEQTAASLCSFTYVDKRIKERRRAPRHPMPYGKVLVVDDAQSNLYVAKGLLAQYKLQVDTAESGFGAIDKIEAGNVYDIILMDHMMPEMDGIETTAKLRESGYRGCIIALTANALTGNDAMYAENGFDGFIPKPIDIRVLDRVLVEHIRDKHPEQSEGHKDADASSSPAGVPEIDNELWEIFAGEAGRAITTLREAASSGDMKRYTITVHAMKSTLAVIGQQEASDKALALEEAGHRQDYEYISENSEGFITMLEAIIDKIRH